MNRFYDPNANENGGILPEAESRHCATILRHKVGDTITIMDGKGNSFAGILKEVSNKACSYLVESSSKSGRKDFQTHLYIAPTKSTDRMEWLVEKLSEIGVDHLSFFISQNSERRKIRIDRLEKKAVSAMKQSGNPFLLKINAVRPFLDCLNDQVAGNRFLAHVDIENQQLYVSAEKSSDAQIFIGPEGDFTDAEVAIARKKGVTPVSLGSNTLRTETAGFVACCYVNYLNGF
ncbi:MAG: RsmE family RNA methyltransferase [Bacteroidota bacterium]